MAEKDINLIRRINNWLHDWVNKIKAAFEGIEARSPEAKAMLDGKRTQQAEGDVESLRQYARKRGDDFRTGQNAMGVYTQTELIDLENMDSEYWTGNRSRAKYKMDDTEFKQVYQEIEKLSRNLPEYGTVDNVDPVPGEFTVFDGKGREFWYTVEVDGYMHGEIHQKVNAEKYKKTNANRRQENERSGRRTPDIIGRADDRRNDLGRSTADLGDSIRLGNSNAGYGRMGGKAPKVQQTGDSDRGSASFEGDEESLIQNSRKRDTMSDLEVLDVASKNLPRDTMPEEQQKALDEFRKRMDRLRALQDKRAELGKQYKEQVFTKGGKREEGEKTRAQAAEILRE